MQAQPKLKIIVKNIPTKNGRDIADDFVEEFYDSIDYYDFISPEDSVFCSAIIHFKNEDAMNKFVAKYHQHTCFLPGGDKKIITIETCINQKVPGEDRVDELNGTLENDPIFQSFIKSLPSHK